MIFHDVQQNSDEWYALRLGKATASNFACIMANDGAAFGDPAKRYAHQIALEQYTGKRIENSYTNEHIERGHEQEPLARMRYEEEHFTTIGNGGFFDCGTYGDSPDGLVGTAGVIEIKSVIAWTHRATIKRGAPDPAYRWQLVGHLDCTGRDWVDFCSFCADYPEDQQLAVYRVNRSDCLEDIEKLRQRRRQFIETLVADEFQLLQRGLAA